MIPHPPSPRAALARTALAALIVATVSLIATACAPEPTAPAPTEPAEPTAPAPTGPPPPAQLHRDATSFITPGERSGLAGCPMFPVDHAYHATVTSLAAHPRSSAMIAATTDSPLRGGFGSSVWMGSRTGIPVNVVDGRTAARTDVVVEDWRSDGSHVGMPLPDSPRFEGWPGKAWDAHLLVVDSSTCTTRELLNVRDPSDDFLGLGGGRWWADAASSFDLRSNASSSGSTASRTSLLAGMVRYDEVASGRIDHVLGASLPEISSGPPVWPAMGTDGRSDDPDAIPMGSWLRLRADADTSQLGAQARVVAAALQKHGVVIGDTGPGLSLAGEPDERWDDADLGTLGTLSLSDFEIVDASPMMVRPDSYQLRR